MPPSAYFFGGGIFISFELGNKKGAGQLTAKEI